MYPWRAYAFAIVALIGLGVAVRASDVSAPSLLARAESVELPQTSYFFGAETNYAPFWVGQRAPATPQNPAAAAGPIQNWSAIGPIIFRRPLDKRGRYDDGAVMARGIRPLYMEKRDADGKLIQLHILYPLFNWRSVKNDGYRWDILNLINHEHGPASRRTAEHHADNQFDIWPFYFSTQTGKPETSFRALFPIYGHGVTGHLLQDRIDWFLFPGYWRSWRNGVQTTAVLWPIFRHVTGAGHKGFSVWPLFGWEEKPGEFTDRYYLWPFFFRHTTEQTENTPKSDKLAVLPFYYRETEPGLKAESFMMFFGYSHRTAPYVFNETRYFWPLVLQSRGDNIRRDRFAPFYTYSNIRGLEKTWVMWPLWKQGRWNDGVNAYNKKQFFFFLYNDVSQKRVAPPNASPKLKAAYEAAKPARKISIWPLFTYWTDGRGRHQLQALSPLEVFLAKNEPTRLIYSPLFVIYRYDQEKVGHIRHSFLWDFVTYRREPELREFHVGPLYSGERVGEHKRRAIFCGVLGFERKPGQGWRPFAFKFKSIQQQRAEDSQPAGPAIGMAATPAIGDSAPRHYPQVRKRW